MLADSGSRMGQAAPRCGGFARSFAPREQGIADLRGRMTLIGFPRRLTKQPSPFPRARERRLLPGEPRVGGRDQSAGSQRGAWAHRNQRRDRGYEGSLGAPRTDRLWEAQAAGTDETAGQLGRRLAQSSPTPRKRRVREAWTAFSIIAWRGDGRRVASDCRGGSEARVRRARRRTSARKGGGLP